MKRNNGNESSDVVSLKGFRQVMTYNPIVEVEAYWEALRGIRVVPLRSEIDPRGIERALDRTFLLERIAPGLARFRLAGSQLNGLMGMEVRGMPLTSLLTPDAREDAREALNQLFEVPRAVTMDLKGEGGLGRSSLVGRMILLPLKSDLGDISRALGCMSFSGKIGRTPRRMDVTSVTFRDLTPFRTEQPETPETPAPSAMAEAPAEFRHKSPARKKRRDASHLRLVKSDDD